MQVPPYRAKIPEANLVVCGFRILMLHTLTFCLHKNALKYATAKLEKNKKISRGGGLDTHQILPLEHSEH